jgi:peptide/nickel transport system permease protein
MAILKPLLLLLLIEAGTVLLVRIAPGYFTDSLLLDARLGAQVHAQMQAEKAAAHGPVIAGLLEDTELLSGKLGESRFFHVPVKDLLSRRWKITASLIFGGLGLGWLIAVIALLPTLFGSDHLGARVEALLLAPMIVLLAIPAGALAAVSLSSGHGTPMAVIALLTSPRVYRFLSTLLGSHLQSDHFFYARSLGVSRFRLLFAHLAPCVTPELLALFGTTFIMTLGIVVPVEVIFDLNGIGQLAWTAVLNRDAPVIAATTLVAAAAVALGGILTDGVQLSRIWRSRHSGNLIAGEAQ